MTVLINLHNLVFAFAERSAPWLLPTLARLVFVSVLAVYFWNSGLTKLGDGLLGVFHPSFGAYAQIFPRTMEAVGSDVSQLGPLHWLVVVSGTAAEFVLPLPIAIGLMTRIAALGMIAFVVLQSLTDVYGHGTDAGTIGAWFDRMSGAQILDQRALWVLLLIILVVKGAGPWSFDRLFVSMRVDRR